MKKKLFIIALSIVICIFSAIIVIGIIEFNKNLSEIQNELEYQIKENKKLKQSIEEDDRLYLQQRQIISNQIMMQQEARQAEWRRQCDEERRRSEEQQRRAQEKLQRLSIM